MTDSDSNSELEVNDNLRKNVREVLEQLVAHFGQKIHFEVLVNSYSKDTTSISVLSSSTNGTQRDQSHQKERPTPPILQLWLDRLMLISRRTHDPATYVEASRFDCDVNAGCRDSENITQYDEGTIDVICEWIRGYEEIVRVLVFGSISTSLVANAMPTFDERCVPILKNYALVLSRLLLKLIVTEKENNNGSTLMSTIPSSYSKQDLLRIINILSTDVTLLTVSTRNDHRDDCNENKNDENNRFRRNEGLPTLLHILGNTLETLRKLIIALLPKSDNDRTNDQFKIFAPECFQCLRLCAVTLLAFNILDDGYHNSSFSNSAQSISGILLPHNLSPSLSTSKYSRNKNLTLLRRMLKHFDISINGGSSDSSTNVRRYLDGALEANSLSYDDLDDDYWNLLLSSSQGSFSTVGWIDPNPNNFRATSRIIQGIWCSMASLLISLPKEECQLNNEKREKQRGTVCIDVSVFKQYRERRDFVLKMLGGPGPLLREVRAHFFGRNLHAMEDLAQRKRKCGEYIVDGMEMSTTVVRMGRRVAKKKNNNDVDRGPLNGKIYERVPSRIATAVNALGLLILPALIDDADEVCIENLLEDIFHICAALLDSNNAALGTFGAAGFLRAIDVFAHRGMDQASTNVVEGNSRLYERSNVVGSGAWINFAENTLTVLDRALKSSSDHGHVVVAIGRAQSRLFETMLLREEHNNKEERKQDIDDRFRQRRRAATEQWLLKLERSLYRPTTERHQLELLLGGVIPLLCQHATDESFEADGMELGRLGLAALLPLTTNATMRIERTEQFWGGDIGNKTQMASMVALINLIFATHPIMASHGGKIMSHLLTTAASTKPQITRNFSGRENEEGNSKESPPTMDSIRNMAILIAAIVLVLCDSKFASQLLVSIEKDPGQYQQNLLSVVSDVREVATGLTTISLL